MFFISYYWVTHRKYLTVPVGKQQVERNHPLLEYPSGQPSVGVDEKLTLLSAVKTTPRLRDSPIGGDAVGTLCIRSAGDGFLAQSSYTVVGDFHFGMQALELRLNFRGKWRLVWLQEKIA